MIFDVFLRTENMEVLSREPESGYTWQDLAIKVQQRINEYWAERDIKDVHQHTVLGYAGLLRLQDLCRMAAGFSGG